MNVLVSKHYYCAFVEPAYVLGGEIGGGDGAVLGGGWGKSASAGEKDWVKVSMKDR